MAKSVSEKSKTVAGQLDLFDEAELEVQLPGGEADAESIIKEHTRRARRTNDETFKGVPSRNEVVPLSDGQRRCADCGSEMEVIGKEFVRREFRITPAKGEVVNVYHETAKCPRCSTLSSIYTSHISSLRLNFLLPLYVYATSLT